MHVLPTPTSYIYVGVSGSMHVLPTPTSIHKSMLVLVANVQISPTPTS